MLRNWRFVISIVLVLSVASLVAATKPETGTPTGVAPTVYITNGADQIFAVDTVSGALTEIYARDGLVFEGLTYGPDKYLYACAPSNETVLDEDPDSPFVGYVIKIIRFDPTDPLGTVETLYTGSEPGLQQPQCGEFNHKGDFLVTKKDPTAGAAVWAFKNETVTVEVEETVVDTGLPNWQVPLALETTPVGLFADSSSTFEGLTQRTNGDLYFVNSTQQAVETAQMEVYTGDFLGSATSARLPTFTEPIGVAVSSRDDLFVAEDGRLRGFVFDGSGWVEWCEVSFKNQRPFFLDFATKQTDQYQDVLFLGVEGKNSGKLVEIVLDAPVDPSDPTGQCSIVNEVTVKKPVSSAGAAVGVAVPGATLDETLTHVAPGIREAKISYVDGDPTDELHNLFNHAMNLFPVPAGCESKVVAEEWLAEDICRKIRKIEFDPATPPAACSDFLTYSDPCAPKESDGACGIDLNPVIYFAEEFAQVYQITDADDQTYCGGFPDGLNLAASFFSQYLRSPQLGFCTTNTPENPTRCEDLGLKEIDGECCGVLPLNMYFPNDGAFPRDRTIGGRSDGRSIWFALDNQEVKVVQEGIDCLCPNDQMSIDPDFAPTYSAGSTIPLRIQVLEDPEFAATVCSDPEALALACQSSNAGDYVTTDDMKILLSHAYRGVVLEDGVFDPVTVQAGGNTSVNPPYFSAPNNENASSWTFQLKAPLDPGLYKVVLFFVNRKIDYPIVEDPSAGSEDPGYGYENLLDGGYIERYIYVQ